jgi:signal transduction histidine kinase
MELRGPITEPQRQDLDRIQRANQHLMSLVNDVLNFARLDAGQIEFNLMEFVHLRGEGACSPSPRARARSPRAVSGSAQCTSGRGAATRVGLRPRGSPSRHRVVAEPSLWRKGGSVEVAVHGSPTGLRLMQL